MLYTCETEHGKPGHRFLLVLGKVIFGQAGHNSFAWLSNLNKLLIWRSLLNMLGGWVETGYLRSSHSGSHIMRIRKNIKYHIFYDI